ncbi:PFS domain-containing protein [Colletotrichum tofieldiae]|nr:PFS domain-containing protein [Colletotrichum tofieldiae]GKT76310.1 PFS domain-containing protein [Colletotrichum tofieldiae]
METGLRTYERYTVAVVCAIEFEMSAVRYMLDREHPSLPTKEGDSNIYVLGELSGHDVVLACLPGSQGKGAAATVATNMTRTFPSIKWRFFVGIGGGVPSNRHDIRLGDVIVSMPEGQHGGVVQYDLGRETDDGFVLKGFLTPPPSLLRAAAVKMRSDHLASENKIEDFLSAMLRKGRGLSIYRRPSSSLDVLFESGFTHEPKNATCEKCDEEKRVRRIPREFEGPEIHYGLIASGDRVVKSTTKRDEIIRNVGDVLCFEMEAAGLMTEFSCIVIRGISDYADSHKNDDWQRYAAATAAACTKELLAYVDPVVAHVRSAESAPNGGNGPAAGYSFHGTGIQNTGSFSVGKNLNIGGQPGTR